ncbi:permease-like cell division protein FtsX [Desulfotomaculum copahuensis]|uniref:Cell division protein FtsX n=1 Tax=Desulfotomaculum copahuensis TaxID=1838280 RepID=A0A1B7LBU2_9FIRM|nr:permease-like cell division protein FtsX [Desulfotomaculum copahuensis]OAT80206.1 cell division protein FtsX [Desulfotomaculum copahuensis]
MRLSTIGYYFREAFSSLVRNSWLSLASVGTVTVSLLILGFSLLLVLNADRMAATLESSVEISAFLHSGVKQAQITSLEQEIKALPGVTEVRYVSKEQALTEMRQSFGQRKDILDGLDKDNPLPDAFRIKTQQAGQVPGVAAKIQTFSGVDEVRYGRGVVEKLLAVTHWIRVAGMAIMIALAAAAVFLISTTIRMSVFARRREISIMKFLGATNWFVRFPFLLEGMVLGLAGSLLAGLAVYFGYFSLARHVNETLPFIPLVTGMQYLLIMLGGLIALGLLIGALGSAISIRRFLNV